MNYVIINSIKYAKRSPVMPTADDIYRLAI